MLIFSVVIFVFSTLTLSPRPPLPRKVGVVIPSSYGSAAPVSRGTPVRPSQLTGPMQRPQLLRNDFTYIHQYFSGITHVSSSVFLGGETRPIPNRQLGSSVPTIFATFHMHAYRMRNNNQILHGDQTTSCPQKSKPEVFSITLKIIDIFPSNLASSCSN